MPVVLAAAALCVSVTVHDGDTIRCGRERVRVANIDAPELPGSPKCQDRRVSYAWCDYRAGEAARVALETSDALLVVGSSLMVYSGFRFARMAHEAGKPIALLGLGRTRADAIADMKLEGDCAAVLPLALPGTRVRDTTTG